MITFMRFILLVVVGTFSAVIIGTFIYFFMMIAAHREPNFYSDIFMQTLFWSGAVIVSTTLLAASSFGDDVAKLFFPIRKQSLREEGQIAPAMANIQKEYRQKYGKEIKVNVHVMDLPHINGIALGQETVAVSTGLLKVATEEELEAVLAHETGHLHNGDGVFNMALITASFPIMFGCTVFSGIYYMLPEQKLSDVGKKNDDIVSTCIFSGTCIIMLICGAFLWASLPAILMMRLFKFFTEWPIEYRADKFAGDLGYGPALVSLFEHIEDEDVRGASGFLKKYIYSHPPTALRIDRLERAMELRAREVV